MIEVEQSAHDRLGDAELARQGDLRHVAFEHCVVECDLGRHERRQRDGGLLRAWFARGRDPFAVGDVATEGDDESVLRFMYGVFGILPEGDGFGARRSLARRPDFRTGEDRVDSGTACRSLLQFFGIDAELAADQLDVAVVEILRAMPLDD